jgi:hypothetical protein
VTGDYQAAVQAAADRITLDEGQRAQLALLLAPVRLLSRAVAVRPDLPVGIVRQEVATDGAP